MTINLPLSSFFFTKFNGGGHWRKKDDNENRCITKKLSDTKALKRPEPAAEEMFPERQHLLQLMVLLSTLQVIYAVPADLNCTHTPFYNNSFRKKTNRNCSNQFPISDPAVSQSAPLTRYIRPQVEEGEEETTNKANVPSKR